MSKRVRLKKYLTIVSDFCWSAEKSSINNTFSSLVTGFIQQREFSVADKDKYFIFPSGIRRNSKSPSDTSYTLGFLDSVKAVREELERVGAQDYDEIVIEIGSYVRELIDYIYIPSEIDYEKFTKIEGATIQSLMGSTIEDEVRKMVKPEVIKNINGSLDKFLTSVEGHLEKYEYKKPAKRQVVFNATHLTSKIVEVYFDSKVLNLKGVRGSTPVSNFSSGEKRKALIDIAEAFILKARNPDNKKKVIFSLDEPEISLHLSACFDQFKKLEKISDSGVQVLISTHWYGFFPAVSKGVATYITEDKSNRKMYQIRLERYREDIKHIKSNKEGAIALNVELKSINDTVQSVISSILSTDSKWVVCEGYSDKIYLTHYLPDVRVISVGKCMYVKKFYEYLTLGLSDVKSSVLGKVFFLLDTDKDFESVKYNDSKGLKIRRLQNVISENRTGLLKTSDTNHYPPTEIEDSLDSVTFAQAMDKILVDHNIEIGFRLEGGVGDNGESIPSGLAFDLKQTEKTALEEVFDIEGVKVNFAKYYCDLDDQSRVPAWITEIDEFLENGK